MASVRTAIVTDDRFFRDALLRVLRERPELEVLPLNGELSLQSLRTCHAVIVDARDRDVLHLCRALSADSGPAVIFVNAVENDAWACSALDAGARGILTAASRADDVIKAIQAVRDGDIWCRRRWLYAWVRDQQAARGGASRSSRLDAVLSQRERDVFHLAALGAGNKEIASHLGITEATVKAHLTRIFQKIGVGGRAELAAAYHGLHGYTLQTSYDQRRIRN